MVECNRFEVSASISDGAVIWTLKTDLPEKTIVMLSAIRFFHFSQDQKFERPIFEDRFFCLPSEAYGVNGSSGAFDIEEAEAESIPGLKRTLTGDDWKKMRWVDPPDLLLELSPVPYQRELIDRFGEDNSLLCGRAVSSDGSLAEKVLFQHPYSFRMDTQ